MIQKIRHIYNQRHLIQQLVFREIKGRYVGSAVGIYWSIINPLVMLAVYSFIFSGVLKVRLGEEPGITNFALYLFCGFLAWSAFHETVQRCTTVILDNAPLIKNLSFPSKVLPVSIALNSMINEMIGLCILVIAVWLILGFFPVFVWLLIPLMVFQLFFGLGLGLVFSTIQVFFRDTVQFVAVLLSVWMFGTPLFYPERMVPNAFRFLIGINPMAYLIRMFRSVCLKNVFPDPKDIILFTTISIFILAIGYSIYTRRFYRFIDQL